MRDETSWELFFQTGLPEAYLLAKQRENQKKEGNSGSKESKNAAH